MARLLALKREHSRIPLPTANLVLARSEFLFLRDHNKHLQVPRQFPFSQFIRGSSSLAHFTRRI